MMNEFKPCPICGSKDIDYGVAVSDVRNETDNKKRWIYVECIHCENIEKRRYVHEDVWYAMTMGLSKQMAIDLWNGEEKSGE